MNSYRVARIALAVIAATLAMFFTEFAVALIAAWIVLHEYHHGASEGQSRGAPSPTESAKS